MFLQLAYFCVIFVLEAPIVGAFGFLKTTNVQQQKKL